MRILWKWEFPAHWEQEDLCFGGSWWWPLWTDATEGREPGAAAFICSERMWPKPRCEARETRPHLSKTTNKKKGPATLGDAASPAKVQTGTLL